MLATILASAEAGGDAAGAGKGGKGLSLMMATKLKSKARKVRKAETFVVDGATDGGKVHDEHLLFPMQLVRLDEPRTFSVSTLPGLVHLLNAPSVELRIEAMHQITGYLRTCYFTGQTDRELIAEDATPAGIMRYEREARDVNSPWLKGSPYRSPYDRLCDAGGIAPILKSLSCGVLVLVTAALRLVVYCLEFDAANLVKELGKMNAVSAVIRTLFMEASGLRDGCDTLSIQADALTILSACIR